jgi:predicted nucleic acid-binding protein
MIVLDSSFLIAFHNRKDVHHEKAAHLINEILNGDYGQALLPEYVVLEVATVLLLRRGLAVSTSVITRLLEAREIEFVPCSEHFLESLQTFRNQPGDRLSFVDSAIATIARRHPPGHIATFDKDFRDIEDLSPLPD